MNTELMVKITDILSNMNDKLESILNVLKKGVEFISTEQNVDVYKCPVCKDNLFLQSQVYNTYPQDYYNQSTVPSYIVEVTYTYCCSNCSSKLIIIKKEEK